MFLPPVSCYNLRAYAGLSLSAGKVWHSLSGLLITQPTLPTSPMPLALSLLWRKAQRLRNCFLKPVGRPRKLRVQIPDSKLNYQILSQAVDEATHEHYLLLVADGDSLTETLWVPTNIFQRKLSIIGGEKKFP